LQPPCVNLTPRIQPSPIPPTAGAFLLGRRAFSVAALDLSKGVPYADMTVGVPREVFPGENRVAGTPESVGRLVKQGFKVRVEKGAGAHAGFADAMVSLVCRLDRFEK